MTPVPESMFILIHWVDDTSTADRGKDDEVRLRHEWFRRFLSLVKTVVETGGRPITSASVRTPALYSKLVQTAQC